MNAVGLLRPRLPKGHGEPEDIPERQSPYRIHRHGKDRYGRTLAVVTISGRSVDDMLVGEGLTRTWSRRRESWCNA
ncbi:MAG: thermonuclease family protein [Erythrobacter sp.]|nr:thermonuclease family protein [Erythrobacter sp.]